MPFGKKLDFGFGQLSRIACHRKRPYRIMSALPDRSEIETWYRGLQDRLCASVEDLDKHSVFTSELWNRPGGGGGDTRILTGELIEKAAVNFSAVWGESPPLLRDRGEGDTFFASGVSMIVHPRSPHIPTFHANIRYFETEQTAWFGGGADLTPYYLNEPDIRHFHGTIRQVCDQHPVADYSGWKHACDEYFYLPHRSESRGAGGIFFDHLTTNLADTWLFQQDLGGALMAAYAPLVEAHESDPINEQQQAWLRHRRGRYAEFNLAWDRGTRFGLETGGRAESILASLPPVVTWSAYAEPTTGSPERAWLDVVRGSPQSWA